MVLLKTRHYVEWCVDVGWFYVRWLFVGWLSAVFFSITSFRYHFFFLTKFGICGHIVKVFSFLQQLARRQAQEPRNATSQFTFSTNYKLVITICMWYYNILLYFSSQILNSNFIYIFHKLYNVAVSRTFFVCFLFQVHLKFLLSL